MKDEIIKIIRYDESNENIEGIKGNYGQYGDKAYSLTLIKNVLFVVLYNGCNVDVKLPTVYDGFLITNKQRIINVVNSKLTAKLAADENAQGTLVLKRWN